MVKTHAFCQILSMPITTALVHVRRGDAILDIERGEPVTVLDFYVVPNGITDPRLVCVIVARRANGDKVSSISTRFAALPDESYETRFPSDMDRVDTSP